MERENDSDVSEHEREASEDNVSQNTSTASSIKKYKKVKSSHFTKSQNGFKCNICDKKLSIKSSHSTFVSHLKTHENASTRRTNVSKQNKQSHFDQLVLNFVIHGNHAFSIVDEEHFKKMLNGLNSNYSPLSPTTLTVNIQKLFKIKQNEVIETLKTITNKISITFDFWTSITNKPYVVVTAHFINNSSTLQSFILDFDLIPYPHNSENILNKIVEIFNLYGLKKKILSITTDNEKSNVKCLELLRLFHDDYEDVVHTRCLAHILNLAVKKGLKEVQNPISAVSKLVNAINFSPKKKQAYFEACTTLNMPQLGLVKEINIRWNSTYLMLKRAFEMKDALNYICQNNSDFQKYLIEDSEWNHVKLFMDLLMPFYDATLLLSKSKYPSIYYVLPILDVLMNQTSNVEIDDDLIRKAAAAMFAKLQEFSPLLRTDYAKFSVVLDPRLKADYFSGMNDYEDPLTSITLFYNNKYNLQNQGGNQQPEPSGLSESSPANTANKNIFSSIYKRRRSNESELQKYLSYPIETEDTDVMSWWKTQGKNLPYLQSMAFDILSIPATSVPSEQSFSKAGNLINKKRNRLCDKNIRSSMSSWQFFFGNSV